MPNAEFLLYLSNDHAVGMGGQQELHDAQARFRSHGGEHIGVACHVFRIFLYSSSHW